MLTRTESQQLLEKILKFASYQDFSASVDESEQASIRFANNGVTTAGFTIERTVTVQATKERKTGISQTTDLSDASLRSVVKRAEELAAIAPPDPERVEALGPQKYADYENFDDRTASARAPELVPHVKAIIDAAVGRKLVASGFFDRSSSAEAFLNTKGNFGYQRAADSRLTTTIRQADGSSSGWAGKTTARIAEISGKDLAAVAIEKCLRWKQPARIEPGKYPVVLEPTAVNDLVRLISFSLNARAAEEGRSFLSRKGGGTLVGEKLFPETITLRSDAFDKRFPTQLWTQGNLPNRRIAWIEKGVVKNLAYDRYWAGQAGKEPTPFASSLVLEGGTDTVEDLIKATERGLLITRFWYIRAVNPQTVQYTGLTRDGVFLIENGVISKPVMNLRFNDSPVNLLQNAKRFGRQERVRGAEGQGMIAPSLQTEMTFTSISDAV